MRKEIILPTERRKAQNYNPRLMVLFGFPKSGKGSIIPILTARHLDASHRLIYN